MASERRYCYTGCCTEWEQEIHLYIDGELSPAGCERVRRHLAKCEDCACFYRVVEREEQLLSGRLRQKVAMSAVPSLIADQVMDVIPSLQPITWGQRITKPVWAAASYCLDQNRRHYALAASMLICVIGVLLTMRIGNVEEEHFVHIKRNGTLMRVTLFEPIYISRPEGEFIEFPDGSLAYATYDTWFSVNAYQDEGGTSNVGTDRRLSLKSGELYLDVRPAKEGFSVICPNSRTMVFGTQFYIRINSGPMKETTVVVRTGQVSVEKLGKDQMASTIVEKGYMTKVFSYNGTVRMRIPYKADPLLMKRLNLFNEAKEDRSAQRLVPLLDVISKNGVLSRSGSAPEPPILPDILPQQAGEVFE
ncbi:MAG TPA: zf-HC2 domain-containing protein [bacterium]|nr:hypothetical protein [Candidatus Omnitrophota bacterium]HOJ59188.1 zf-HC2 domain-containing protein [bacterium]HOL95480.1 zf-HC2 domain-containing protein [bacterium]HPP00046.1 zf-HC2 domain-containing protein [bacterium]HXK92306.1 zf-HC2 domain-containing protein [bacterium]